MQLDIYAFNTQLYEGIPPLADIPFKLHKKYNTLQALSNALTRADTGVSPKALLLIGGKKMAKLLGTPFFRVHKGPCKRLPTVPRDWYYMAVPSGPHESTQETFYNSSTLTDILSPKDIRSAFKVVEVQYPIACKNDTIVFDIETSGLNINCKGGIKSIAYSYPYTDEVFTLYLADKPPSQYTALLKEFYKLLVSHSYVVGHNITFDMGYILAELGEDWQIPKTTLVDTTTLVYLKTNNVFGNTLGLKFLTKHVIPSEYALNNAQIQTASKQTLLEYNAIDVIGTMYLYTTYKDAMSHSGWPFAKEVTNMSLRMKVNGLPVLPEKVQSTSEMLISEASVLREKLIGMVLEDLYHHESIPLFKKHIEAYPVDLKKVEQKYVKALQAFTVPCKDDSKPYPLSKLGKEMRHRNNAYKLDINLDSLTQLRYYLFELHKLPPMRFTTSGQEALDTKAIQALEKLAKGRVKEFLGLLREYAKVNKLVTTYVRPLKAALPSILGFPSLAGSYRLSTVSGRLSSSDPNLQNLPSKGREGKLIKGCIGSPDKGWIFVGSDYNALEDRVAANFTRDPNRLITYKEGYDGHCLRAFKYYHKLMPDISQAYNEAKTQQEKVQVINSIESKYPTLRNRSKGPSFAMQYACTTHALVHQFDLSEEEASTLYNSYSELYSESFKFGQEYILRDIAEFGYIRLSEGLTLLGLGVENDIMKGLNSSRYRSAFNAIVQTYCTLTARSAINFHQEVLKQGLERDIYHCSQVHDFNGYLVRRTPDILWVMYDTFLKVMQICEDTRVNNPDIPYTGTLELYPESWANPIQVPEGMAKASFIEFLTDKGII